MSRDSKGVLYVVATPIGNLEDITLRALKVLKLVRLVAAEDTRRSGILLRHFGIETSILSVHEHNERARVDRVVAHLSKGESVALVTDAGTPGISDPGAALVSAIRKAGSTLAEYLPDSSLHFLPQRGSTPDDLEVLVDQHHVQVLTLLGIAAASTQLDRAHVHLGA